MNKKLVDWFLESFLCNIRNLDIPYIQQAAKETDIRIKIKDNATDNYGNPILDCRAIYMLDSRQEHNKLLRRAKELKILAVDTK
jgi:hypothetical protein